MKKMVQDAEHKRKEEERIKYRNHGHNSFPGTLGGEALSGFVRFQGH